MAKNQENLWKINTDIEEDDVFDFELVNKADEKFILETQMEDDSEDFFQEFNKPSTIDKKITKQERLDEYKKINTKMSPILHRMLKTYCGQNDFKKNEVFKEALELFMNNNASQEIIDSDQVNGINVNKDSSEKKAYNFEVNIEFFKRIKTFASMRDMKMITLYEQAIIEFLHKKRFKF